MHGTSGTEVVDIPEGSWDCHTHCFDPEAYPFGADRAYTPLPAKLPELFQQSFTDRVVLVQASVEDGSVGLLANLAKIEKPGSTRLVRGIISIDHNAKQPLTENESDRLHSLGVRSIRIHGIYGGSGQDADWVRQSLLSLANEPPIASGTWTISAQLPLRTWAQVSNDIKNDSRLGGVRLVADHNGSAAPSDLNTPEFDDFLDLLRSGRFSVKVGALHRRTGADDLEAMRPIVEMFANAASDSLVWGSDWPHIDASKKGLEAGPFLSDVDTNRELWLLKSWLTPEQWLKMMVTNPERLFGT